MGRMDKKAESRNQKAEIRNQRNQGGYRELKIRKQESGNPVKRTTRAGRKPEKTVRELRELREFLFCTRP